MTDLPLNDLRTVELADAHGPKENVIMHQLSDVETKVIGAQIGGYRVTKLIGQGGMGAVFLAEHRSLDKRVAIKVILPRFADRTESARAIRRFQNEAQALAKVTHPSLVQIYDTGVLANGTFYIEMEHLVGETLGARLEREGRLSPRLAISLVRQLAAALKELQSQGITHRDLKPSNVFLVADPEADEQVRAKLLDFGLAQIKGWSGLRDRSGSMNSERMGSARYMAPEQCQQEPTLGSQTDVYALGVILFEALTGESPYGIDDCEPLAWLYAHVTKPARRLRDLLPDASVELDRLVAEMLNKQPAQRPTPGSVEARLRGHLSGQYPVLRRGAKSWVIPAVLIAGVGLLLSWRATSLLPWMVQLLRWFPSSAPVGRTTPNVEPVHGMVLIPGATFVMGSTQEEATHAYDDCIAVSKNCTPEEFARETHRRTVTVHSLYLDKTEVTNEAYVSWLNRPLRPLRVESQRMVYTDRTLLLDLYPQWSGIEYVGDRFVVRADAARKPVAQVTWDGAMLYCASLGQRLPTEAEWELAARGESPQLRPTPWPWGYKPPTCEGAAVARWPGELCSQLGGGSRNVGTSPLDVTPHGVYDLGGNVREWVLDRFVSPYPDCGDCVDPPGPKIDDPGSVHRVVRGGNWMQAPTNARSANRGRLLHSNATAGIGFRCAAPQGG